MIKSVTKIKVRYAETDQMGFVYHSNYFVWMDVGRTQMLEEIGLPYNEFEAKGYMLPVIEANILYKSPARFNDTVLVHSFIKTQPKLRILITYELFCGETMLCQGYTSHVFVKENVKPVRPPLHFTEKINSYFDHNP